MEDLLGQRPEGYTNAMAYPIPQVHTSGIHGAPSVHPEPLWVNIFWALFSYFLHLEPSSG